MSTLGTIILGGLELPVRVAYAMAENEQEIGGYHFRRMHSGALRLQEHWSKFRIALQADGISGDGLAGLDVGAQLTFKSQSPRSIFSATEAITVPAARRTDGDYAPRGYSWRAGVRTPDSIASTVGNVITLTTVAGAAFYEVEFFRELTIMLTERPSRDLDSTGHRMSWRLVGEEV